MNKLPRSTGALAIAILLVALPAAASPREVRMHGPNGDGGACPDASVQDHDSAAAPQVRKRATPGQKAKATPMVRSGDGGSSARPRWHSILPGMFR